MAGRSPRLAAGRGHHHGGHSRTGWRHSADDLRRAMRPQRKPGALRGLRRCDLCEKHGLSPRARRDLGRPGVRHGGSSPQRARGTAGGDRAVQFSAEFRCDRHGRLSRRVRIAVQHATCARPGGIRGGPAAQRGPSAHLDHRRERGAAWRRRQRGSTHRCRFACAVAKMAGRDRAAMGGSTWPPAERRPQHFRARKTVRQCVRGAAAGVRLRGRPDAAAIRKQFCSNTRLCRFLSLDQG